MPPPPPQVPVGEALTQMRATLARFDGSQFAPQAKSLDAQIATTSGALSGADAEMFVAVLNGMSQVLPGVTSGVLLAVEGFEDGDTLSGVQGLMDTCASLIPVIGAAIGAGVGSLFALPGVGAGIGYMVGALVGSIFNMISDILAFFAPKTESLAQQIETILQNQQAEEAILKAQAAHYSFLVWTTSLNDYCSAITGPRFQPGVTTNLINQLNLVEGNTMMNYWWVTGWLSNPKNQSHRQWPLILNAACNAYTILLIAVFRLQSIVSTDAIFKRYTEADAAGKAALQALWDAATAKLEAFRAGNRLFLGQLKGLTQPARQWGTLWRLTSALEAGVLIDPNAAPTSFGGRERKLSVTVCSKDQALAEPPYHAYLINWPGSLDHERIVSYASGAKKMADTITGRESFDLRPDDVYATPGTDLTKESHARVYELYNGKQILGKYRDEKGKEIETFFKFNIEDRHGMTNLTSVRAVHDPYVFADDPANAYMKGVKYMVYGGGCTPTSGAKAPPGFFNRILVLPNGHGHGAGGSEPYFVSTPLDWAKGIAVDQDYLWVYANKDFFCATHAALNSVYPVVTGIKPLADVSWTHFQTAPLAGDLDALYPCEDGTLVVSTGRGDEVYSAAYRAKSDRITASDASRPLSWTKIGNYRVEGGLEKLPVFCWPQFESLKETLETLQTVFFS